MSCKAEVVQNQGVAVPNETDGSEDESYDQLSRMGMLPWNRGHSHSQGEPNTTSTNEDINPGEFVLRALFTEFTVLAERKIDRLLKDAVEKPLSKSLQRGEDPQFDQLLSSLSSVAEHCLSSLLRTLFQWYDRQTGKDNEEASRSRSPNRNWSGPESPRPRPSLKEKDPLWERRDLAVEFIFCLVLIEVLKQLSVHPVEDSQVQYIENLAFRHFKDEESNRGHQSQVNRTIVTALYAEVIGVLAQTRFQSVRKRFMQEYKENQGNPRVQVNVIHGLKFIRIKLYPVDELEESFLFLQELATLFLEKNLDKEVKYAFTSLFVEILIPVASVAKREYNVPAVKKFVDLLFKDALEMAKKAKHIRAMYPLVTALLCISQKQFFLTNWIAFLNMCLSQIKSRDIQMQRMSMECLHRLIWVYVIRIKCENHASTIARLRSVVDTLFPKGSRTVVPRNVPLTIFVKIIQFIGQEKLDFAMQDVIFDLLNIGKGVKQLNPERMNIGLRAFLVIADNLQRKEGAPPMPGGIGALPSRTNTTVKVKKAVTKLTEEAARNIGVVNYYTNVRRALDAILRTLDAQVGRPMTMMNPQFVNKDVDDITGERKAKIDLFRTCVAAIPKCIPDGMTKQELIELVSRLTLHKDEELKTLAFTNLQSLIMDFPEYREEVLLGYISFVLREVPDIFPNILENSSRMLLQLLVQWRTAALAPPSEGKGTGYLEMSMQSGQSSELSNTKNSEHVLHCVEGFALIMLCSTNAMLRKLAFSILKEARVLVKAIQPNRTVDNMIVNTIEECSVQVIEKALCHVWGSDKSSLGLSPQMDLQLLAEKSALLAEKEQTVAGISRDLWAHCLAGFLDRVYSGSRHCSCIFQFSWPFVYTRLFNMYSLIDPSVDFDSITSRASSISFKAPKKTANLPDICLWRNYLIFVCSTPPKAALSRSTSMNSLQEMLQNESEIKFDLGRQIDTPKLSDVLKTTVLLIRSESNEIREAAVTGLGKMVPIAHGQFVEEMHHLIREVLDRKAEGVRKKRKRDLLRLQVVRVFAANADQACFRYSLGTAGDSGLSQCISEYIEGMRHILDLDNDKDEPGLVQLRLYFSKFLHKMIKSIPSAIQGDILQNQTRHNLFFLLASWCGHFNVSNVGTSTRAVAHSAELEFSALEAMCALLCCGEVFDQKALEVANGYLYRLLDTMLTSENNKVHSLGQDTLELMFENNKKIPSLLKWVIDRCYTGKRGVSNGCFLALANVFSKKPYPCQLVPMLCVVLFKTGDSSPEIRERAAQLLYLLDRRFFSYMIPFRAVFSSYSYGQQNFSQELAVTHSELTLPMLSELTLRFGTTSMVGQRYLLHFMLPWLGNIELIDVAMGVTASKPNQTEIFDCKTILKPIVLLGMGWGSSEASQMVLNNLFYLTVKYDEFFSKEIEACWAALSLRCEENNHLIFDYLIVMAGLCGTPVLSHAKKVAIYVARANTMKSVDELMEELKLTETVTTQWDRMDSPPYYKPTQKLQTSPLTNAPEIGSEDSEQHSPIHAKHNSFDQENDNKSDTSSIGKRPSSSQRSSGSFGSSKVFAENVMELTKQNQLSQQSEDNKRETGTGETWARQWTVCAHRTLDAGESGIPLPMPEDLKYFAPLTLLFPMTIPPAHLYRCNFALVLLTEIVSDRPDVHWIIHLPLMLHVAFLGLDHMKPLVHEHCKRLLINLVITLVCGGERSTVAKALMDFQSVSNLALDRSSGTRGSTIGITEEGCGPDGLEVIASDATSLQRNSLVVSGQVENGSMPLEEKARQLIEFLAKSDCKPLWAFEDITPRHCSIKSAEQLEAFLCMVLTLFEEAVPHALLLERWGREALHWATSCSSRHYAGRSFQVFRALHVPLSWTMLSDILQRLAESVAETSDDVQGYVLEILFTFLSEVDCAKTDNSRHQIEALRQGAARRPSLDCYPDHPLERSCSPPAKFQKVAANSVGSHNRSLSSDFCVGDAVRNRSSTDNSHNVKKPRRYVSEMVLSRVHHSPVATVPSLKEFSDFQQLPESPLDMFARLFWIAVSLFESDYEHEFVMAIKLLEKVLEAMDLTRSEALERIEKLQTKLNWQNFPGVQSLLLKGLTSNVTAEPTLRLLSRLTVLTSLTVVDPSPVSGLSLNIIALLPRLIVQFDDPDEFSVDIAQSITKACDKNKSLSNLGKVMVMYKDKEYSKSVQVWIECVCKYILDTFPHLSTTILALLVEILEQGPPQFQQAVLNMICAILKYSDASSPGLKQFHNYLLKIVTAHVKDVNLWKESLNILKLVVSNASQIHEPAPSNSNGIMSSALVQPRGSIGSLLSLGPHFRWGTNQGLADSSWSLSSQLFKKELPGRTLEFTYNVAATPLIGAKFSHAPSENNNEPRNDPRGEGTDIASPPSGSGMVASSRKTHSSQRRTRERLVSLLPLCGHKGGLKQSLSVIFSSSSDLAVDSKPALSSEETSGDEQPHDKIDDVTYNSRRQINNVMKEFDFLDELDNDSEDMTNYWASADIPNDDPYGIGQVPSRSGSEPDLVGAIKDEELTDEEDSESLQLSSNNPLKYDDTRDEQELDKEKTDVSKTSADTTETKASEKADGDESSEIPCEVVALQIPDKSEKDELSVEAPEPSPVSVCSADSTLEALDRAQIVTTETILCAPRYFVLSYEEIPYKWSTFVTSFVASSNTAAAADSLPCFPMVLKACGYWLQRLTRECCDQFESGLETIHTKFVEVEETLENELKLPYVFVDQEIFKVANLLTKHKFAAIKLNEGLQVLQEKREQAQEHLDLIQATKRGSSLDSDEDLGLQIYQSSARDMLATDTRVMLDLSTCLYRIHMQFVMCLEVYLGYIEKIVAASKKNEVNDFSDEIEQAADEVSSCCNECDTESSIHSHITFHSPISSDRAVEYMIELLKKKDHAEALRVLQGYRNQSWSDFIGRKDDELETLIAIYTRFLMSGKTNYIAVSGSVEHLNELCDKLSEFMADLLSRIYEMTGH